MSINSHRMDGRSEEKFARDIKVGTERERLAITLFRHYLRREEGFTDFIMENGVDMTGGYIADDSKVTAEADYIFKGKPLEVKTSHSHSLDIYLKVHQVRSYIKQGASLLFVNGMDDWSGKPPAFIIFSLEDLKEMEANAPKVNPINKNGGKLSYKLDATQLHWTTFGGKVKKYVR